jgi:hypothetical protein
MQLPEDLPLLVYGLGAFSNLLAFFEFRSQRNELWTKLAGAFFAYFLARFLVLVLP